MMRTYTLATALTCLLAVPAAAQQDTIRGELRGGWRTDAGTQMAAVHMVLAPGWKTYWRAPGDNGIPPSFNWSGSDNVRSVHIHWPRPHVYDVGGLTTIGYSTDLVLPLEVTPRDPSKPIRLQATVDLGVCRDICVPASFSFSSSLPNPGASDPAIHTALAKRASTAREGGLTRIHCDITPSRDGLTLTARMVLPPTGGTEVVVVEPGQAGIWVSEADVMRNGSELVATVDMVPPSATPFALPRNQVVVTVLGTQRAVEIIGCPSG